MLHPAVLLVVASSLSQLLVVGVDRSVETFRNRELKEMLYEATKIGDVTLFHLIVLVLIGGLAIASFGVVIHAASHDKNLLYFGALMTTVVLAGTTAILNAVFTASDSRNLVNAIHNIHNNTALFEDRDGALLKARPILPAGFWYIFCTLNILIGVSAVVFLAVNRDELQRQRETEDEAQVLSNEENGGEENDAAVIRESENPSV